MPLTFAGPGISSSIKTGFNEIGLAPGQVWTIYPAGTYAVKVGGYTCLQYYDTILQTWRPVGGGSPSSGSWEYIFSDGQNMRLANLTGCAVGASVTNVGSGYTSAPTVTASAGSSIWRPVIGGAVSQTVTVSNGGSNYAYPPLVGFAAPPSGGIQATGYATLSGGAVSTITMVNQGGGYSSPPTISFTNDPREGVNNVTQGSGAAAVCSLTGAKTIAGIICVDPGTGGLTALPTLTISGGGGASGAATAIMCWSITSFSLTGGTNFTGPSLLSALDAFPAANSTILNPAIQSGWVKTRMANILIPETASVPTANGATYYDGGIYTSTPTPLVTTNGALITQTTTPTFAMGGYNDTSYIST